MFAWLRPTMRRWFHYWQIWFMTDRLETSQFPRTPCQTQHGPTIQSSHQLHKDNSSALTPARYFLKVNSRSVTWQSSFLTSLCPKLMFTHTLSSERWKLSTEGWSLEPYLSYASVVTERSSCVTQPRWLQPSTVAETLPDVFTLIPKSDIQETNVERNGEQSVNSFMKPSDDRQRHFLCLVS